jgi:hypothetical protein
MLKINDSVKVKPGIKDPDTGKYDMSHWQGRICDIEEQEGYPLLITIAWDSLTLKSMPKSFVEESIRDGYAFEEMNLYVHDVERTEPRDMLHDSDEIVRSLEDLFAWVEIGKQAKRIQAVEDACLNDFDLIHHWFALLAKNLEIPCKVIYKGGSNASLQPGTEITLNGLLDANDKEGIIGTAIFNRRSVQVRLCEVAPVKNAPQDVEALEDYLVWFAKR